MATATSKAPRWDMTSVYPGLDSPEFEDGLQDTIQALEDLKALFDRHVIGAQGAINIDDEVVLIFEEVIDRYNAVNRRVHTLSVYISCFVNTDSSDDLAQSRWSEYKPYLGKLSLLTTRLNAWIGSWDIKTLLGKSAVARDHALMLQKAQRQASHLMSPVEEALASELNLTGGAAWTALWNKFTSQLRVTVEGEEISMSDARKRAYNPDRNIRKSAYEAELETWEKSALPLVAALNALKGEQNTLARRRGWSSPLEAALLENNIDEQTLDALMQALREAFPDIQRYWKAKARVLGIPKLAWFDLVAPIGGSTREWSFDEAKRFIVEQFETYSPKMARLANRAFNENWIDAEPRSGKVDSSYCARLRDDESRILVAFKPTFFETGVIAHELGHAYHNMLLAQRTALQRQTPMILAETASTFCQTLVQQGAIQQATGEELLNVLDSSLQFTALLITEPTTWFMFEKDLYERRHKGELSLAEIKALMVHKQKIVFGDAFDSDLLHPFDWTAWPQLFWSSFYNFAYPFGLLFAQGLYGLYQDGVPDFKPNYDDLLSSTGLENAAELAARFGIDIRTPDFWQSSLDMVRADIDRFESVVDQYLGYTA